MALVRDMTFEPYNTGSLRAARHLESSGRSLFPRWQMPLVFTFIVLFLWLVFILYKKFISEHKTSWDQLFASITNKSLCASAITILASVYMPSNLACLFQLAYRTKLRQFPPWLNNWLLNRKQLGLLTFALGVGHAIISSILMSPEYFKNWYKPAESRLLHIKNQTRIIAPLNFMVWSGELATLLGVLALLTMSLLAIASIPAAGNLLNWREWQFVQSKLGTCTLLLAIGHVFSMALPVWIRDGFVDTMYSIGFPTIIFPVITLLMKFILCLPCFSRPINRTRRGEDFK
jgi:DMSO/TMAO reductase YedYZ heme-binding membrane subunit